VLDFPPDGQFKYRMDAPRGLSTKVREEAGISEEDYESWKYYDAREVPMLAERAEWLEKQSSVKSLKPAMGKKNQWAPYLFPFDKNFPWNVDNYGPIYIPKKGATVELNLSILPLYKRLITVYENNTLKVKGDEIFINGELATNYTFKMNYYWLMGDNRHNSADSRFWGFVPEDHVVGKASFVWLSLDPEKSLFDGKIRWSKLFRVIK